FFSSRRRHTRSTRDWSSDVCSSDLRHLVRDCWRLLETAAQPGTSERLRRQCEYFVAPADLSYAGRLRKLIGTLAPSGSPAGAHEIGRASCRERAEDREGRGQTRRTG